MAHAILSPMICHKPNLKSFLNLKMTDIFFKDWHVSTALAISSLTICYKPNMFALLLEQVTVIIIPPVSLYSDSCTYTILA